MLPKAEQNEKGCRRGRLDRTKQMMMQSVFTVNELLVLVSTKEKQIKNPERIYVKLSQNNEGLK